MTFVYPSFLWALLALLVPIIIHLFNFRRYKKIYFTNVKFLRELQEESKSRSRLRELIILTCRCLALACLVFAFAQPVLNNGANPTPSGSSAVGIYIDNSFSAQNTVKQGPLIDVERMRARQIVNAFSSADRFQLLTNDFEGRHQRLLTKEDALTAIDEIKVSPAPRLLSEAIQRQSNFLSSSAAPVKRMFILSDAQKSTFNLQDCRPDSNIRTSVLALTPVQPNNTFLDTCWFESPLQQKGFIQKLHVRVVNDGAAKIEAGSAKLFLNGSQTALASFSLDPGASTEVLFTFECKQDGFNYGSVKIEDYPVTFDDELYFAFNASVSLRICLLNGRTAGEKNALTTLFKNDSLFKTEIFTEQGVDYAAFKRCDVLVLNQLREVSSGLLAELQKFTQQGGALLIVPPADGNITGINEALTTLGLPKLGEIDTATIRTDNFNERSVFFSGVFEKKQERVNLPLITRHYSLLKSNRQDFEPVINLQNGDCFLGIGMVNNARVFLTTSPFSDEGGNFTRHALFVPALYRLCFSAMRFVPMFYHSGANDAITVRSDEQGEEPPHIIKKDSSAGLIPEAHNGGGLLTVLTRGQIKDPGFYTLAFRGKPYLPMAFNYQRRESKLQSYTISDLDRIIQEKNFKNLSLIEDTGTDISQDLLLNQDGKKIWKLCLLLTLGFIALELLLLRLLK
mgnify:CR=1 FL=1